MAMASASKCPTMLFGSFGYGNIGDEAVPSAFGHMARAAGEDLTVLPVSRFAKAPMPGIVYMQDAAQMDRSSLAGRTVFLSGGGIIEPHANSCLNRLAELRRKTVPFNIQPFAISCEPGVKFNFRERRRLRQLLQDLPEVLVRDEVSQRALEGILRDVPVRVIGDIVLWLEGEALPEHHARNLPERYVAVSLASIWSDGDFFGWVAAELAQISRRLDAKILLVPISNAVGDDVAQHRQLCQMLNQEFGMRAQLFDFQGEPFPKPEWIAEIYSRASLVISSRLHGCVIAYACRTPFVGIGYHPKLQGFARTVGWEEMIVPKTLPPRQSPGRYGYSWSDLSVASGAAVAAAESAIGCANFSARDYFRMKQVQAFRHLRANGAV